MNKDNYRAYQRKYYQRHRHQILAKVAAWKEANPERLEAYRQRNRLARQAERRQRIYGMSAEDYATLLNIHGGRCAICATIPTETGKMATLRVDHDHVTGAVRGLLCWRCNAGLGMFQDDSVTMLKAAWYVDAHRNRHRRGTA